MKPTVMRSLSLLIFIKITEAASVSGYPGCNVENPDFINDGGCDGGEYNTFECGFDGGDCLQYNNQYPNCQVPVPYWIGYFNICDGGEYNTIECGWDGGDCCAQSFPNWDGVGNNCVICEVNSEGKYLPCTACEVDDPLLVGNGICNGGVYNSPECGYDGGDCIDPDYPNCHVSDMSLLGDGNCERGDYNTEICGWDKGDCLIESYPDCHVPVPNLLGNGYCNTESLYNTDSCGFDDGDCLEFNLNYPQCKVDHPSFLGDGICYNIEPYNTESCGYDGGDCISSIVSVASSNVKLNMSALFFIVWFAI